jgi:single-strand DNA-binding protein
MSGSVNKVILIGNLGRDPEIRSLENGVKLARFSMATSETYNDRSSGEKKEITEWHNIVAWRGLAEVAEKYFLKGMKIYVEGRLKTRSWQDDSNMTKYSTEIIAENMTILSSKNEANSNKTEPYTNLNEKPFSQIPSDILKENSDDDLPF